MLNLSIETTDKKLASKIKSAYEFALGKSATANQLMLNLERKLGNVKVGKGGSHIWISDSDNNRLAIITEMIAGTLR